MNIAETAATNHHPAEIQLLCIWSHVGCWSVHTPCGSSYCFFQAAAWWTLEDIVLGSALSWDGSVLHGSVFLGGNFRVFRVSGILLHTK